MIINFIMCIINILYINNLSLCTRILSYIFKIDKRKKITQTSSVVSILIMLNNNSK